MLGIPYMGSKRKLAKSIIDYILKHNPNTKYFYDVFGGGGAMSFEAIQRQQIREVFYNDFDTSIVELIKKIQKDGVTKEMYRWVDRETYNKYKDDSTWYGGFLSTVWSFGNNKEKGYLFSRKIEEDKRLLHEIVVNKCKNSLKKINDKFKTDIALDGGIFEENITQRRLRVQRNIKERVGELQHLTSLEQLERLTHLNLLKKTNLSYEKVKITTPPKETIIFLDPPYENTAKYSKGINYKEFYDWIGTLTRQGYKVYLSSYNSPLFCVKEFSHRSSLSATVNKKVIEKLFSNIKDKKEKKIIQGSLF